MVYHAWIVLWTAGCLLQQPGSCVRLLGRRCVTFSDGCLLVLQEVMRVYAGPQQPHADEVLSARAQSLLVRANFTAEQKTALADLLNRFYMNLGRCVQQHAICVLKFQMNVGWQLGRLAAVLYAGIHLILQVSGAPQASCRRTGKFSMAGHHGFQSMLCSMTAALCMWDVNIARHRSSYSFMLGRLLLRSKTCQSQPGVMTYSWSRHQLRLGTKLRHKTALPLPWPIVMPKRLL